MSGSLEMQSSSDLVQFTLGGTDYFCATVDVDSMIDEVDQSIFIPGSINWLSGAVRVENRMIPLLDLSLLFGGKPVSKLGCAAMVVHHAAIGDMALAVSTIGGMVGAHSLEMPDDLVMQSPPPILQPITVVTTKYKNTFIPLVDFQRIDVQTLKLIGLN